MPLIQRSNSVRGMSNYPAHQMAPNLLSANIFLNFYLMDDCVLLLLNVLHLRGAEPSAFIEYRIDNR